MPRDDGRPALDKDREIRIPWALLTHPKATGGVLKVYAAIRAHAGFEATADNFMKAWPAVETIAREACVKRDTVLRAVTTLQDEDFLIVWRRPNKTSVYGLIVQRERFQAIVQDDGRAEAIDDWELNRAVLDQESRSGQAEVSSQNRRARPEWDTGRKSHASNRPVENGHDDHAVTAGGRRDATDPVASMQPGGSADATSGGSKDATRSVFVVDLGSKNCDPENRGSTDVEPVSTSFAEQVKVHNNGNGHSNGLSEGKGQSEQQPPVCRCTPVHESWLQHVQEQAQAMKVGAG